MRDVVSQVQGVSAMMSEIAEASLEQSAGIDQIGDAVQSLDQMTQQNAALVESAAAAASEAAGGGIDPAGVGFQGG